MRIIIITSSNNRSGGSRQAIYQAQGLADRGHDVTLCLPHDSSFWELPEAASNPLWYRLPTSEQIYRETLERLLPADPDTPTVIHAFHNKAVKRLAWWGLSWRHRNLICVAHRGVIFHPGNPLPYWSPAMKAFIVNSHTCARSLRWHCPAHKIFFIPNGIPDSRITPGRSAEAVRNELDLDDRSFTFVYVGNNNPVKGTDTLLEAFAEADLPDARLVTVGVSAEKWDPMCRKLGIERQVRYAGYVETVCDYLQVADAFVFPSRGMDSAPNTLMEAIRMGLPTISTTVGGAPDLAEGTGILVPADNPQKMAEAMRSMSRDSAQREIWAAGSLEKGKRYSVEARCRTLEELYAGLLSNRRR